MPDRASATAPCTVGNFGPGFDVLSLALARAGDTVELALAERDEVVVRGIGADRIPREWARNVACGAIDALRERTGHRNALRVTITKGAPPGSGLGSSASSAAASVHAYARLFGLVLSPPDALHAAGAGEAVATGSAHFDDVAAALYGGLAIVGGGPEEAVVRLHPPPMTLVVARPDLELATRDMRALLPGALSLLDVRAQLSMVARVVAACEKQDLGMLSRALGDRISKPARSPRIPGFADAEAAARKAGALAVVLCGSGPSMLAVLPPGAATRDVEVAMKDALDAAAFGSAGGVETTRPTGRVGIHATEVFVTTPAPEVNDAAVPLP